jgi:hypothetical protein
MQFLGMTFMAAADGVSCKQCICVVCCLQSKAMASEPPRASAAAATQLPLTVLVNEHTASASEILAGESADCASEN